MKRILLLLLLASLTSLATSRASAQEASSLYVRASAGWSGSYQTILRDRACEVTPLLNLFGCGAGQDGRSLGARGSFGSAVAMEGAVGVRVRPAVRFEAALSHRAGFELDAQANFRGAGTDQPVAATVEQTALMGRFVLDFVLDPIGPFVPFVGGGFGVSHNKIGDFDFEFPALTAQPATTTSPGGESWSRAWDMSAGASLGMGDRMRLDVEYRYSDLGRVVSDDGQILVIRGTRQTPIDGVAGLTSRLRGHGVMIGIRRTL